MRLPVLRPTALAAGCILLGLAGTGPAGAVPGDPVSVGAPSGAAAHQGGSRQLGQWTVSPAGD